jgi:hypothetical protein
MMPLMITEVMGVCSFNAPQTASQGLTDMYYLYDCVHTLNRFPTYYYILSAEGYWLGGEIEQTHVLLYDSYWNTGSSPVLTNYN